MPKRKNSDTAVLEKPKPQKTKPKKRKTPRYMHCAADYPAQDVQWLWPGRIPLGKVTLLSGDPGTGKSLLTIDIASRVSRGAAWPDEKVESPESRAESQATNPPPLYSGEGLGEGNKNLQSRTPSQQNSTVSVPPSALPHPPSSPGSVLILSIEDDLSDTIRPRLDAAGADPKRVFVLSDIDDLRHDMDKLRDAVDAAPDCRLIVIDSINAFVGPGDSHFHTIVRRVLRPLAELAAEHNLAVLAVSHFRKSEGAVITRATGSMGFVAASRAVWTVSRDATQPGRHLMMPMKNNFVAAATGLAFHMESKRASCDDIPAVVWHEGAVTDTTQDATNRENKPKTEEESEIDMAAAWLREELARGPKPAICIYAEGTMGGEFSTRTMRRALHAIGGRTRKDRFDGGWIWELPDQEETQSTVTRSTKAETTEAPEEGIPMKDSPVEDTPETLAPSPDVGPLGEKLTSAWPLRTNAEEFADFDSQPSWKVEAAEGRPEATMPDFSELIKKFVERKFATQPPPE
jgi:putative DNA primase/helicase